MRLAMTHIASALFQHRQLLKLRLVPTCESALTDSAICVRLAMTDITFAFCQRVQMRKLRLVPACESALTESAMCVRLAMTDIAFAFWPEWVLALCTNRYQQRMNSNSGVSSA